MDRDTLYELKKAFLEEWITREDLVDALQRERISHEEYLWLIGVQDRPKVGKIIVVE